VRKLWALVGFGVFAAGAAGLALTAYLWLGDWPQQTRELVDHYRSVARNTARPPEPLVANVRALDVTTLAGTWQAVIDPFGRGELGGMAPRALASGPRPPDRPRSTPPRRAARPSAGVCASPGTRRAVSSLWAQRG
jgi:hypothetical protein